MSERYAFISYAHADYKLIRDDILSLAQQNSIWLDKARLTAGDRFDDEIESNMTNASAFIMFLTMNYGDSDYCLKEIKMAKKIGIPICVISKDSADNIQASAHGKKILDLVRDLYWFMDGKGRTVEEELHAFARENGLTERDCTEGKPNYYFPKYNPVFVKPEQLTMKYTYNYVTKDGMYLSLIGRDKELEKLHGFVENHDKLWCMITGPGGSGKSRLLLEFATVMHEEEWDVYYLDNNIETQDKRLNRLESLKRNPSNDRLVIIDYAVAHSNKVSEFLHYLNTHKSSMFKTKVILADRDMNENSTTKEDDEINDVDKFYFFMKKYAGDAMESRYGSLPLISLRSLSKESLQEVMRQYSAKVENKTMEQSTAELLQRKLAQDIDPHMQRPLYAIFMAEAWANGDNPENWKKGEALEHVLNRETRIWLDKASIPKNSDVYGNFTDAMIAVSARATFNGDIALERLEKEDPENVGIVTDYLQYSESTVFADYLDEVGWYKKTEGVERIAAFRPDLLGEYIVLEYMKNNEDYIPSLFAERWFDNPDTNTFLSNLYYDFKQELFKLRGFWDVLLEPCFSNEDEPSCIAYYMLIERLMDSSNFDMSRRIIGKLEQLANNIADKRWREIIFLSIADEYKEIGDLDMAYDYYQRVSVQLKKMLKTENTDAYSRYYMRDYSVSIERLGDVCIEMARQEEALGYYQQFLEITKKQMDKTGTAMSMRDYCIGLGRLGDISDAMGRQKEALEYYNKALEISERLVDETGTVESLRSYSVNLVKMGDMHLVMGRHKEALGYFKQCEDILKSLMDETGTVQSRRDYGVIMNKMGDICKVLGWHEEAFLYYVKDLRISRSIMEETGTAQSIRDYGGSLLEMGYISRLMGKQDDAHGYYRQFMEIAREVMEETGTVDSLGRYGLSLENMGIISAELGKQDEAYKYYTQFIEISKKLYEETNTVEFASNYCKALEHMGRINISIGKLDEAFNYYKWFMELSKKLMEETGTVESLHGYGMSLGDMGDISDILGRQNEALRYYEQQLKIAKELLDKTNTVDDRQSISTLYGRLGDINNDMGHQEEALSYYRQSLEISKKLAEETGTMMSRHSYAISLGNMGEICKAMNRLDEALKYYRQFMEVQHSLMEESTTVESLHDYSMSLVKMGDINTAMGHLDDTRDYYMHALEIRKRLMDETSTIESMRDYSVSLEKMGDISDDMGRLDDAFEYYTQELEITSWLKDETGTIESRRDYGRNISRMGDICKSMNRLDEALGYYRQFVDIQHSLMEESTTVESLHDYSTSLVKMGDINVTMDRQDDALEYYRQSLRIGKRLVEETGTAQSLNDYAVILAKIGLIRQDKELLISAQATWKYLSESFPNVKTYAKKYEIITEQLKKMKPSLFRNILSRFQKKI